MSADVGADGKWDMTAAAALFEDIYDEKWVIKNITWI